MTSHSLVHVLQSSIIRARKWRLAVPISGSGLTSLTEKRYVPASRRKAPSKRDDWENQVIGPVSADDSSAWSNASWSLSGESSAVMSVKALAVSALAACRPTVPQSAEHRLLSGRSAGRHLFTVRSLRPQQPPSPPRTSSLSLSWSGRFPEITADAGAAAVSWSRDDYTSTRTLPCWAACCSRVIADRDQR